MRQLLKGILGDPWKKRQNQMNLDIDEYINECRVLSISPERKKERYSRMVSKQIENPRKFVDINQAPTVKKKETKDIELSFNIKKFLPGFVKGLFEDQDIELPEELRQKAELKHIKKKYEKEKKDDPFAGKYLTQEDVKVLSARKDLKRKYQYMFNNNEETPESKEVEEEKQEVYPQEMDLIAKHKGLFKTLLNDHKKKIDEQRPQTVIKHKKEPYVRETANQKTPRNRSEAKSDIPPRAREHEDYGQKIKQNMQEEFPPPKIKRQDYPHIDEKEQSRQDPEVEQFIHGDLASRKNEERYQKKEQVIPTRTPHIEPREQIREKEHDIVIQETDIVEEKRPSREEIDDQEMQQTNQKTENQEGKPRKTLWNKYEERIKKKKEGKLAKQVRKWISIKYDDEKPPDEKKPWVKAKEQALSKTEQERGIEHKDDHIQELVVDLEDEFEHEKENIIQKAVMEKHSMIDIKQESMREHTHQQQPQQKSEPRMRTQSTSTQQAQIQRTTQLESERVDPVTSVIQSPNVDPDDPRNILIMQKRKEIFKKYMPEKLGLKPKEESLPPKNVPKKPFPLDLGIEEQDIS